MLPHMACTKMILQFLMTFLYYIKRLLTFSVANNTNDIILLHVWQTSTYIGALVFRRYLSKCNRNVNIRKDRVFLSVKRFVLHSLAWIIMHLQFKGKQLHLITFILTYMYCTLCFQFYNTRTPNVRLSQMNENKMPSNRKLTSNSEIC